MPLPSFITVVIMSILTFGSARAKQADAAKAIGGKTIALPLSASLLLT